MKTALKLSAAAWLMAQIKSRITPQIHRAGRQAGAIKPVRRSGWEWAASLLQLYGAAWTECTCAGARIRISLSRSLLLCFPQSWLPYVARRGASHRSAMQGPGKRALCHSSSIPIQFTVSNTFTSCDSRPCSKAPMSLLDPRRGRELVLPYCLLSWARQKALSVPYIRHAAR